MKIVGTCSICSGPVSVPTVWMGVHPPTPTCNHCGAHPKKAFGPVIDMEPTPRKQKVHKPSWLV